MYSHMYMYIEIPYIMFIISLYHDLAQKRGFWFPVYTSNFTEITRKQAKIMVYIVVYLPRVSHVKSLNKELWII